MTLCLYCCCRKRGGGHDTKGKKETKRKKKPSFLFSNTEHEAMQVLENTNTVIPYKPQSMQHSETRKPRFPRNAQYGVQRTHVYDYRIRRTPPSFLISEMEFALKRKAGSRRILRINLALQKG